MGYQTTVDGIITIDPPIPWSDIKDSPFLPPSRIVDAAYANTMTHTPERDVVFDVDYTEVDTDDGTLLRRQAVGVVAAFEGAYKCGAIEDDLQEIIAAHGAGRTLTGWLHGEGDDPGDLWRVAVVDGRAVRFKAVIVWPPEVADRGTDTAAD